MPHALTACLFSAAFVVNAYYAKLPGYKVAPIFLIPILWAGYFLRRKLHLHPLHYLLFAIALLLHDLGAYGFYQQSPLPHSYDIYVHSYFGFVGALILHRTLTHHLRWSRWLLALVTLLFVMGAGGIHEVIEYMSTLVLGEERGMIKTTGYRFDTERDLLDNFCGCCAALLLITLYHLFRGQRATRRG